MELKDDFKVIDHYLCIKMPREVDHHNAGYIAGQADEMLCKSEVKNLIFDFSDTEFMDSSGVGIILGRYKKITCFHGKVYAIHVNMQIRKILHMSGLQKIIEVLEEK